MKRALLALVPLALVAAYLAAALATHARAPASPLEDALADHDVRRAAASALPAIRHGSADVVLLASGAALPAAEQRALLRFAETGGTVVLAGSGLERAPLLAPGLRLQPGVVYGADGGPAPLPGGEALPGARSLDAQDAPAFRALARTDARAFRDSNGDGAIGVGEPAGPFTVAADRDVGEGRVVVLAVDEPSALARAPGVLAAALPPGPARIVLVEGTAAWVRPAAVAAHAAALASTSLLAGAAVVLAAAAALLRVLAPRAEAEEKARSTTERLVHEYHSALARRDGAAERTDPTGDPNA